MTKQELEKLVKEKYNEELESDINELFDGDPNKLKAFMDYIDDISAEENKVFPKIKKTTEQPTVDPADAEKKRAAEEAEKKRAAEEAKKKRAAEKARQKEAEQKAYEERRKYEQSPKGQNETKLKKAIPDMIKCVENGRPLSLNQALEYRALLAINYQAFMSENGEYNKAMNTTRFNNLVFGDKFKLMIEIPQYNSSGVVVDRVYLTKDSKYSGKNCFEKITKPYGLDEITPDTDFSTMSTEELKIRAATMTSDEYERFGTVMSSAIEAKKAHSTNENETKTLTVLQNCVNAIYNSAKENKACIEHFSENENQRG